ncbi:NAD(P)H-binding protein [Undibacterium sp. TJN19]|uniref:NAD(P)H-binding protein n=1 Tax=Undibacterium sp. TJN19 TaxID=3413055 RepID=UPI003BF0B8D7
MNSNKKALVLGATGGIGGEVARLLMQRGWEVTALHRNPASVSDKSTAHFWLPGDVMKQEDVIQAAMGKSLIVHAVNPPGYRDWEKLVLPMMDNSIAAAKATGARIVLPGTVYNFGPDVFPSVSEDAAQFPITKKGKIRVELEHRLRLAASKGVKSLIVRAGDFFGPKAANSWFSQGLVTPGKSPSVVRYPGNAGIGHQWAYLPDVAETMVRLIERESELEKFARFHMDGHWDHDGKQMVKAIGMATGNTDLKGSWFPWPVFRLLAPFQQTLKEMLEMRYLWRAQVRMSNKKLVDFLGDEPRTPLDIAVRTTLTGLGCIKPKVANLELNSNFVSSH